jgi:hypothetical protein
MKVSELKQLIAGLKDDAVVSFLMDSGCCGDYEDMEAYDSETYKDESLVIRLKSLPGYKSCIQAGGTKRSDEEYWRDKGGKRNLDGKIP